MESFNNIDLLRKEGTLAQPLAFLNQRSGCTSGITNTPACKEVILVLLNSPGWSVYEQLLSSFCLTVVDALIAAFTLSCSAPSSGGLGIPKLVLLMSFAQPPC